MEKLIINPSEVRGLGDIVSPKSVQDFNVFDSELVSSTDTTYGTVYTDSYLDGSRITLSADKCIGTEDSSFTVSCTLKNKAGYYITSATVYLAVNNNVMSTTTNSNGEATFTVSTDGSLVYKLKAYYTGTSSVAGCWIGGRVVVVDADSLTFACDKSVMQSGDDLSMLGRLTGTNGDGEIIGVPGKTISFYEEWTPGLKVSAEKSIIQTGTDMDVSAQLIDVSDGSLVREAGHTVYFFIDED